MRARSPEWRIYARNASLLREEERDREREIFSISGAPRAPFRGFSLVLETRESGPQKNNGPHSREHSRADSRVHLPLPLPHPPPLRPPPSSPMLIGMRADCKPPRCSARTRGIVARKKQNIINYRSSERSEIRLAARRKINENKQREKRSRR